MTVNTSKIENNETLKKFSFIKNALISSADRNMSSLIPLLEELEQSSRKEYGLVFENHHEEIEEKIASGTLSLTEESSLKINNGGLENLLIEGDNLASLSLLEKQYSGKIDLIYIDPPYNIGKKYFRYNDNYNSDEEDSFSHSKWASFMEKRLKIARNLLSEKASIFVSINWKEQATLKFLLDKIFGEENFITCITWSSQPEGDDVDVFETTIQHIYVYCKDKTKIGDYGVWEKQCEDDFIFQDNRGKFKFGQRLEKSGFNETPHTHPEFAYSIYYNPKSKDVRCLHDYNIKELAEDPFAEIKYEKPDSELLKQGYFCIRPEKTLEGEHGRWRFDAEAFSFMKNEFCFEENVDSESENDFQIFEKDRFTPYKFRKAKDYIPPTLAIQNSLEILEIFGKKVFDSPKPLPLLEYLIQCGLSSRSNPNLKESDENEYLILDFFAGSGSTGHAVLELNKKDSGKRKFILCTNNENNIAKDVTYQRLKTVITGKRPDGSTYSDGFKATLKYLKSE